MRRAVLQVVGKRAEIIVEDEWAGRTPSTRIVVIGATGAIDRDDLRARFDTCLAMGDA